MWKALRVPLVSAGSIQGDFDVLIVGAGPAGLACAFACHDRGLRVLVLEAGGDAPVPGKPDLLAAEIVRPKHHDPVEIIAASALGGSTHWWGGRTLPLEPTDFRDWPITHGDLEPWWAKAAEFFGSKPLVQSPAPGAFARLERFDARRGECWAPELNMARRWRGRIRAAEGPAILLGARVTSLEMSGARIDGVCVQTNGDKRTFQAAHTVLAGGGLGGLRLLLLAQRERPELFGGQDGPLGRAYMGHLTGSIADLLPAEPRDIETFGHLPVDGVTARRRIHPTSETILRNGLGNIAFWLENPAIGDPAHGSSVASAKYLAARSARMLSRRKGIEESPLQPHVANVARAPVSAAAGLTHALALLAMSRLTGRHPQRRRLISSGGGGWRMDYHAEQLPDPSNRVSLSDVGKDSIGLPRLRIDFRFSEKDCESVVRAHQLLNDDLAASGAGRLRMSGSDDDLMARVMASARDGYHQLGGAVMSSDPDAGVVDVDARVHGLENLWIASSSVFPTGGQANPTLTIVALALRLADHIARLGTGAAAARGLRLETA